MIYIEPIDPAELVLSADRQKQLLLSRNFSEISLEEASNPEIIDPKYAPVSFLMSLLDEYYAGLQRTWELDRTIGTSFTKAYELPPLDCAGDLKELESAYKSASRRSLWEKVTKTNHKDVAAYKEKLRLYSEALLQTMFDNFTKAVCNRGRR